MQELGDLRRHKVALICRSYLPVERHRTVEHRLRTQRERWLEFWMQLPDQLDHNEADIHLHSCRQRSRGEEREFIWTSALGTGVSRAAGLGAARREGVQYRLERLTAPMLSSKYDAGAW